MSDLAPLHFSQLKHIAASPAHYAYNLVHPPSQSAAFALGSAVDAFLIGEGERVLQCSERRGTKAHAAFLETVKVDDPLILKPAEFDKACEMADSVVRNARAVELLQGERQKTVQWSWLGRRSEGTPDVFCLDHLTELKTGRTSHPTRFQSQARWYGYHAQLAWYRRALIESGFGTPASYWIVAVESSPPYPVTVFQLTDSAIEQGERACRAWLERLLVCEASDHWPGYTDAVVPFDVPDESEGFTLNIDGEETEIEG